MLTIQYAEAWKLVFSSHLSV